MINVHEKRTAYKNVYNLWGGRKRGREEKRKETYLNVNKASKLQFVHFKHVAYCMSSIPQ